MKQSILFMVLVILASCTKSDELSPEESLNGSWSGTIIQPEFGELITNFTLSNVTNNSGSGSGSFQSGNISVCDDTQFNCVPLACTFNLVFSSHSGSKFEFDQVLTQTGTTCGDGIFELTVIDKNTISTKWYQEAFPENIATGQMMKN